MAILETTYHFLVLGFGNLYPIPHLFYGLYQVQMNSLKYIRVKSLTHVIHTSYELQVRC